MEDLKLKLEELKKYVGKTDEESRIKFDNILSEVEAMQLTDEEQTLIKEFLTDGLKEVKSSINQIDNELRIREQLKDIAEIVPLSYIAKHYFGKTAAWLYQRINGYKVRGKIYTLNEKEIEILNRALKEIGNKISSLSITC